MLFALISQSRIRFLWLVLGLFLFGFQLVAADRSDYSYILKERMADRGELPAQETFTFQVHDTINILTYNGQRHFFFRGQTINLTNPGPGPLEFALVSDKAILILVISAIIALLGSMVSFAYLMQNRNTATLLFFLFTSFLTMHNIVTYLDNYFGYLFFYLTTSFAVKIVNRKYLRIFIAIDSLYLISWLFAFVRQDVDFLYAIGNFNYITAILLVVFSIDLLIKRTNPFLAINFIVSSLGNILISFVNPLLLVLGFSFYCFYIIVTVYRLISNSVQNEKSAMENLAIAEQKSREIEASNQLLEIKQKELVSYQNELVILNASLEDKVREKTKDINALLNNIDSGILSIGQDMRVSKEYSASLPSILGKKDIANSSFKSLFLSDLSESDDKKDSCIQSLESCLGEDRWNFEVNSGNLFKEVHYKNKILKCDWSVSTDQADRIEKILLVLNDITREKEQERLLREKEIYFGKVKELIDAKEAKSNGFFATSRPLMDRIIAILNNAYLTISDIEAVYVGYHTVKGAARTLGFKSLSNAIHQSESIINRLKSENSQAEGALSINSLSLKENYNQVLDEYNLYWNINKNELNRSDNYNNITIDKNFIEDHYVVLTDTYSHISEGGVFDKDFVAKKIFEQKNKILSLIQVSLEAIFDSYRDQFISVARELKKSKPMFQFKIQDYRLSEANKSLLDNVFTHLIRNIMDHGIEPDTERSKKNKTEYGTVFIEAKVNKDEGKIRIMVKDDGRGLAIRKLKELGLATGRLDESNSIQDIANSIFLSGVSTAKTVSDISGRGIGMGAVKQFLKENKGDIKIVLENNAQKENPYCDFHLEIEIPID